MTFIQRATVLFLFLTAGLGARAQVYPVNGNAALIPPYSVYLADYTSRSTERLMLNVVLNDVARPELRVRLRMKIEGQNVKLETKPEYIGSEIILQGGVPLRLSGTDLTEYFNPNNLNFTGITRREFEKTGALPEGFYQFSFEVLEYNRGAKISNALIAPGWLILNDPPIVNLPRNNEKLRPTVPQNLVFQWTPRHTGSPNSAFSTEYSIEMVELWPANRNPNDAMLTSPRILETTTRSTSFIYGPAETPLELGRQYALRIQAKSIVGVEEYDLFKNNGYSEVITFVYGDACEMPANIRLETAATKFKVMWDGKFNHSAYTFQYRPAGTNNWYSSTTAINEVNIYSLTPNTTYEYQIAGACGMFEGQFTPVATLKTNDTGEASYSCGLPLEAFNLDPAELIPTLKVGDIIQAGDFEVKLTEVSGGNGTFSGKGVIEVPFFNKATVKAEFASISVNKEQRMVNGVMNVTGAGVEVIPSGVMDLMDQLDETLSALDSALTNIENNLPQPFDPNAFVPDVTLTVPGPAIVVPNPDGSVTVTDGRGVQHDIPKGTEAAIIDDQGKGYLVDSKGKVHEVTAAVALAASRREYNLKLVFSDADNSLYGFDAKKYDELALRYDKLSDDYFVPYKSVEVGRTDNLTATLQDAAIDKSKVKFQMGGVPVAATPFSGSSSTVTVNGKADGEQEGLIAILPAADTSQNDQVLGRVNVVSYNALHKNLVIVPVNGNTYSFGSAQTLQTKLNEIYSQAVVSWSVSIAEGISVPEISPFDVGSTGMLSNYTNHMRKVINAYKDNMDNEDTYYLFLVSNSSDPQLNGFMPRSKQAGFIFKDKHSSEQDIARTMAHELGHGAFNLHHTFMEENLSVPEGKTDNLMDYTGGVKLYKYQWDMMRYPAIVIGMFESDEEAQYKSWSMMEGDVIAQIPGLANKALSFLSPTGKIISLPSNARDFTFNKGYLIRFTIENERYTSLNETDTKKFKGYFFNAPQKADGLFDISSAKPFLGKIESTSNPRVIYALKKEGSCGEFDVYSALYLPQLTSSETSGGIDAIVDVSKDISKLDGILSQHTSIGPASDRINCLSGRAKELYKFITEHYASYERPLTASRKDSLITQLARYTNVYVDGLDTIPSVPSARIKMREMLSYGVVEFIGRLERIANEEAIPVALVVEFEDFERYRDTYLVYQIAKKLDVDCALAEKIRDEIDKQLAATGEVEFNLDFFTAVGKTAYEFYSMNELFELLNCLLKNLRAPESLYNPNRLDYQFQGFIKMLFERFIKVDPNTLTAKIPLDLLQYNFACTCGVWNSLVDLVYGLTEVGSGLTTNPIDLSNKVNEFFTSISENGVGPMGSAVWDLIKEHHGYSEITGFDSYQATYAGCYDVVFVASFFVGIGEVKAISEAKSLGEVGAILAKSAKAYPAAIKQIITWTSRLSSKAVRNVVLELLDKLPPGLYLQLPADLKAIHIATALNEGVRLVSISDEGARALVSINSSVGRTKEIVYKSSIAVKDADTGGNGLITIVKLENGTYAAFIDDLAEVISKWFDLNSFKNATTKTPGVDNSSLTNLPGSFWDVAYKVAPDQGSAIKTKVDWIIANGDNFGSKTEEIVNDIMLANDYQVGDGKYFGGGNNGIDGFYYKGAIENPTEIIIIESKQMSSNSATLNAADPGTGLPSQMSDAWIRYIANQKLKNLGGDKAKTANAILNATSGKIKKYVVAVDKTTGEINFLKLGTF